MPNTHGTDEALGTALAKRDAAWCQPAATRLHGPGDAIPLIERAGIVTLYPVSSEFPDLFSAFAGPDAEPDSRHDSPSGEIHTWRWLLGRQRIAFYGTAVRGKPTWVAWDLLPALLRLRADTRSADALYAAGLLSDDARRVADALADAGEPLTTGELRQLAGFETGKERRAAYLKAIAELDKRLMIGRAFGSPDNPDDTGMRQTLVSVSYPDAVSAAESLDAGAAMRALLTRYVAAARVLRPRLFGRHLGLTAIDVEAALDVLTSDGLLTALHPEQERDPIYLTTDDIPKGARQ